MARRSGFTLLELMTSVALTIIILLAVAAAFSATQTVYQREANMKSAVENGRIATAYLENITRYAGYGLDPRFAIDMSTTNLPGGTPTKSNYVDTTQYTSTAITGFATDDFAFRYRDPSYLRRGTFNQATMTVALDASTGAPGTFGMSVVTGRMLQIVCSAGQAWTVVRTAAALTGTETNVAVASANVGGNAASFPAPPNATAAPCMLLTGDKAPFVMVVREVRLRVIPLGTAPNIRPFLVAYNDLSASVVGGSTDFDPIAADVESFQVSYVMNRGPGAAIDSGGDWILGNTVGDSPAIPTTTGTRPVFDSLYDAPERFSADAANVRAVSFDLAVRSRRAETRKAYAQPRLADDPTAAVAADGYFHTSISTTVRTPNLASRTIFVPALRPAGAVAGSNEWMQNTWGG